jgi:hypothetical protein
VQACTPAVDLYVLFAHGAQAEPAGPVYAALQTQRASAELPAGETEKVGQGVHADDPLATWYDDAGQAWHGVVPFTFLYVPAAHAPHAPPSGPVKPASHGHTVSALPTPPEFAGQLVQASEPPPLLYVAARHAVHVPPLGPE